MKLFLQEALKDLPAGVIFMSYEVHMFGPLLMKHETMPDGEFNITELTTQYELPDAMEVDLEEFALQLTQTKENVPLEFIVNTGTAFADTPYVAVLSKEDLELLAATLLKQANDYPVF